MGRHAADTEFHAPDCATQEPLAEIGGLHGTQVLASYGVEAVAVRKGLAVPRSLLWWTHPPLEAHRLAPGLPSLVILPLWEKPVTPLGPLTVPWFLNSAPGEGKSRRETQAAWLRRNPSPATVNKGPFMFKLQPGFAHKTPSIKIPSLQSLLLCQTQLQSEFRPNWKQRCGFISSPNPLGMPLIQFQLGRVQVSSVGIHGHFLAHL